MQKFIVIIVIFALAMWWVTSLANKAPATDFTFSYIVQYSGAADQSDTLPLLIALHGNGDTPQRFFDSALEQLSVNARIVLLEAPLPRGSASIWPWKKNDLRHFGKAMSETVEQLLQTYPTSQKPVLLGFSGGGMMAYFQAIKYGNLYSHIIPVSGMLTRGHVDNKSINVGADVLAFHGKNDRVVSLKGGKKAVQILQKNGVDVNLIEFEGSHQGMFSNMKNQIIKSVEKKLLALTL